MRPLIIGLALFLSGCTSSYTLIGHENDLKGRVVLVPTAEGTNIEFRHLDNTLSQVLNCSQRTGFCKEYKSK